MMSNHIVDCYNLVNWGSRCQSGSCNVQVGITSANLFFLNWFSALKLSLRSLAKTTGAAVKLSHDRDLKLVPLVNTNVLPLVHIVPSAEKL
jgi:hypothetical protein